MKLGLFASRVLFASLHGSHHLLVVVRRVSFCSDVNERSAIRIYDDARPRGSSRNSDCAFMLVRGKKLWDKGRVRLARFWERKIIYWPR